MTSSAATEPKSATAAGSGSEADSERTLLLGAAKQVLERSGWWGFKVESVLKQAQLSTRSFYRHFEKKSDLLLALLEFELGGAAIHLRRVTATGDTPSNRVHAYIAAVVDMGYREELAKPSSLFASHWRELLPEYPEAIDRCTQAMFEPLLEAIRDGAASGEFTSVDPDADARAVFHLVSTLTADQATLGGATPREDLEHIVLPFIARALGMSEKPTPTSA